MWVALFSIVAGAGLIAWLGTGALIPLLRRRAVLDRPNERSLHQVPVPRGGGIAVVGAMLLAWVALIGLGLLPRASMPVLVGAMLLAHINPAYLRTGVGLVLLLYSIYYLARPALEPVQGGVPADIGIGFLNGLLGGLTGLVGIVVVIWCQLRGWPKDVQRAVFQPVIITTSAMTAVWLSASGAVTADTVKLFLLGLPMLLAGTWVGMRLYGRLDEASFRKIVLILLLLSGIFLVFPVSIFR